MNVSNFFVSYKLKHNPTTMFGGGNAKINLSYIARGDFKFEKHFPYCYLEASEKDILAYFFTDH